MRTTNGNQKILAFQQKHLLKLHLVTPHREERKPFSTHKSERQTALSTAKCFSDGGDVWNIPHQLGQCSQFPTCTMPITAGLSRLPALLFHCAQQDDGFVMQMKVDWKPLHWCCSWPPAPFFFSSETQGLLDGKFIHFYCICSWGLSQGTCFSAETSCMEQNGLRSQRQRGPSSCFHQGTNITKM